MNKNLIVLLCIFAILSSGLLINQVKQTNKDSDKENNVQKIEVIHNKLKIASFYSENFIHVNNNWTQTNSSNLWCNGKGTKFQPYVIENVTLNGNGEDICILIENTRDYFEIRNCNITNSVIGIKIINATNFKILDTKIYNLNGEPNQPYINPSTYIGISIYNCSDISIGSSNISLINGGNGVDGPNDGISGGHGDSAVGIYINSSRNIVIFSNNLSHIIGGKGGQGQHGFPDFPDSVSGGSGGNGGNAFGIFAEQSINITIGHNYLHTIIGGGGGEAGNGGIGIEGGSPGGGGGNGGDGGIGGNGLGIYYKFNKNLTTLDNFIFKIQAGSGKDGGDGGDGGDGYPGIPPAIPGGPGGNGGDAGDGGNGGLIAGIAYINCDDFINIWNIIKDTTGEIAGIAGIGGTPGYGGYLMPDGYPGADGNDGVDYDVYGLLLENSNNSLNHLNSVFCERARNNGANNKWDNGTLGNYWSYYQGIDEGPQNGIGDKNYTLDSISNTNDTKPLMFPNEFPIYGDYDNDRLNNMEESLPGLDGYITNSSSPDTDFDGISDYWEFMNKTLPLNNDTDGDYCLDGMEINLKTDPKDPWWYPMPNLLALTFKDIIVYKNSSYFLEFTIKNNGIWNAEGVKIIIRCQSENIILFNNSNTPINIDVDETMNFKEECSLINDTGEYNLEFIIDQLNNVNETYSNKDGSFNSNGEDDNSLQATLTILSDYSPSQIPIIETDEDEDTDDKDSDIDEIKLFTILSIISVYSIFSTILIAFLLIKYKSMKKFAKFPKKKINEN